MHNLKGVMPSVLTARSMALRDIKLHVNGAEVSKTAHRAQIFIRIVTEPTATVTSGIPTCETPVHVAE